MRLSATAQPWRTHAPDLYELVRARPSAGVQVRMDVAAFVGLAERGPPFQAIVLESWKEFITAFGRRGGARLLPEAVHSFFANGGRRCVVVRVVDAGWSLRRGRLSPNVGTARWRVPGLRGVEVFAANPGPWGNELELRMMARYATADEAPDVDIWKVRERVVDLEVRAPGASEVFSGLRLTPGGDRYLLSVLETQSQLVRPVVTELGTLLLEDATSSLPCRSDPARDLLGEGYEASEFFDRSLFFETPKSEFEGYADEPRAWVGGRSAIAALAEHDARNEAQPISLVNFPDLVHPRVDESAAHTESPGQTGGLVFTSECKGPAPGVVERRVTEWPRLLVDFELDQVRDDFHLRAIEACEVAGGWLAVLDLPPGVAGGELVRWRQSVASVRAALYSPYLRVVGEDGEHLVGIPPGGAVCGAYARREPLGVHVAPANEVLSDALDVLVDSAGSGAASEPAFLHENSVNGIRRSARGLALMGARTTSIDPEWRHVSVRRLVDYLARQLTLDTRWAVFEPNGPALWYRLKTSVEARLRSLMQRGAFAGNSAEDSYFVRCGAAENTLVVQDTGRVVALVGVAPAEPAEFITFTLTQEIVV